MMNAYRLNDLYICSILDLNAFIGEHTEGVDSIKYAKKTFTITLNRSTLINLRNSYCQIMDNGITYVQ